MDARPISADSHIVEPKELFDALEKRFGERAPVVREDERRGEVLSVPSQDGTAGLGASVQIGRLGIAGGRLDNPDVQAQMRRGYAGLRPGIADPKLRVNDQDADGVACEVLFPSLYFWVYGIQDIEVLTAAFQSYNDWLASYCAAVPDRLVGLALIPAQDPEAGAIELERAIKLGYRGVCLPCTAPKHRPYHDRAYDKIWALAQDAGIPITFHIFTDANRQNDLQAAGPVTAYASSATLIQITASDLICQGVAHRFPELKFVLGEWETGWIAHWLDRLDHSFYRSRATTPPELDLQPAEYWRRQFYATFEDDRIGIMTRAGIGVGSLMWANDFPHHDSIWPNSQRVIADILGDVPEDERRAMLIDNAARLYKIKVPGATPA